MLLNLKRSVAVFVLSVTCLVFIFYAIFAGSESLLEASVRFENAECTNKATVTPAFSRIPKIVHQSWKTRNVTPIFARLSKSWKKCFPTWKHILWTDADNRQLVKDHFPWFLKRYDALPKNIMRADAARYMYMYVFGGIYADLDTECIRPFEVLLRNHTLVMGAMEGKSVLPEGHTQNSFLYSVPRHPFWIGLLNYILRHSNRGSAEQITGPDALMECVRVFRLTCGDYLKIYPPSYFNPFSWLKPPSECVSRFRMDAGKFLECRKRFANAFVLQYHAHSWE